MLIETNISHHTHKIKDIKYEKGTLKGLRADVSLQLDKI